MKNKFAFDDIQSDKQNGYPTGADYLIDPLRYIVLKCIDNFQGINLIGFVAGGATRAEF